MRTLVLRLVLALAVIVAGAPARVAAASGCACCRSSMDDSALQHDCCSIVPAAPEAQGVLPTAGPSAALILVATNTPSTAADHVPATVADARSRGGGRHLFLLHLVLRI